MIKEKDLEGKFFTINGEDVWKLDGVLRRPQLVLRNMETSDVKFVTPDTETAAQYYPIKMPETTPKASVRKKAKPKASAEPKLPSTKKVRDGRGVKKGQKSSSEYFGVTVKQRKKGPGYFAQVTRGGKFKNLGMHDIEELAAAAVQEHIGNKDEAARLREIAKQKKGGGGTIWTCKGCGHKLYQEQKPKECVICHRCSFTKTESNSCAGD